MDSNPKDEPKEIPDDSAPFNPAEAAAILELTDKQKIFADAILKGTTQVQAARLAGYSGNDANLRAQGSKVIRSPAVQAYLAWGRNGRAGVPDDPATLPEIERTLSKHLRGADKAASLRASELLTKLHAVRAEQQPPPCPIQILDRLVDMGELGACIATLIARHTNIRGWQPKPPIPPEAEARQIKALRSKMTPGEAARVDNVLQLQNQFAEAAFSSAPAQAAPSVASATTDGAAVGNADPVAAMAFRPHRNSRLF